MDLRRRISRDMAVPQDGPVSSLDAKRVSNRPLIEHGREHSDQAFSEPNFVVGGQRGHEAYFHLCWGLVAAMCNWCSRGTPDTLCLHSVRPDLPTKLDKHPDGDVAFHQPLRPRLPKIQYRPNGT